MERCVKRGGFTLIEVLLVSAIIGLLVTIAVPKFQNMIGKAREAVTRGSLGLVRSALTLYYADNEGIYPVTWGGFSHYSIFQSLIPKYMESRGGVFGEPSVWTSAHGSKASYILWASNLPIGPRPVMDNGFLGIRAQWSGLGPSPAVEMDVFIVCAHEDLSGRVWNEQ